MDQAARRSASEAERAETQLEQLGDPSAIPALGKAWDDQAKPARMLQVIILLARPLTPEQAKATYMTDYEKTGRPANWDKAQPFLVKALTEVDEANPRSVDSAQKAADALGEAKARRRSRRAHRARAEAGHKKLIAAQVSAIRAIGKFDDQKAKAAAALIKIIDRDPPDHPRTAKDKEQGRALEEKYGLFLGVTGAAINALADLRVAERGQDAGPLDVPHAGAVHADPPRARRLGPRQPRTSCARSSAARTPR